MRSRAIVLLLVALAVACGHFRTALPAALSSSALGTPASAPTAAEPQRPPRPTSTLRVTVPPYPTAAAPSPTAQPTRPAALPVDGPIPVYTYRVVASYPHDPTAFTQGLVVEDRTLYEGTGLVGRSTLRRVALDTGEVLQVRELPDPLLFGEGIALHHRRIIQLTWKSGVGFVYDQASFELLTSFHYSGEGWGLTTDGARLIMSDGTSTLRLLDPYDFHELGRVEVRDDQGPVTRLNELEYVQGQVYANVWQTDRIARIDLHTGRVTGWIDLTGLLRPEHRTQPVDVLNGIAYDPLRDRLFVTGKLWPLLFEIKVIPRQ